MDMWRDSFVIKAVRNEWVLLNIALHFVQLLNTEVRLVI